MNKPIGGRASEQVGSPVDEFVVVITTVAFDASHAFYRDVIGLEDASASALAAKGVRIHFLRRL